MNQEDRLIIDILNRADAKNHKAKYIHGSFFKGESNGFFAPENTVIDEDGVCADNGDRDYLLREYGVKEVSEERKIANEWEQVLCKRDTLAIASALRELGLPKKEIQRVDMLHILRNPGKGLRIAFDDLRNFNESFAEAYTEERIKDIVRKHIQGGTDYMLTLENSNATLEEKELIMYVFPQP